MTLAQLDLHIATLAETEKAIHEELDAARKFRPFLAKREPADPPATQPLATQTPLIPNETNGDGYGSTMKNLRAAIVQCPNDYTIYNVEEQLSKLSVAIPREIISQSLSRMARKGEILVQTRGAGRVPSVYRKEAVAS